MNYDLTYLETQLKKRTAFDYEWGRKQNDEWDQLTNFIYRSPDWDAVVQAMKATVEAFDLDKRELFNYAANRWFNFWSAIGVEQVFAQSPHVIPALNPKNRLVDFSLKGIDFDHKTSVFPKGFKQTLTYAQRHENELIRWLYKNQSQQQRKHLENRLFVVVYAENQEHWKCKAELSWLQHLIEDYLKNIDLKRIKPIEVGEGKTALSDVIWAVK